MKSSGKILGIVAILLLLINIALIIFILNGRKHPETKRRGGAFEMMDKELNLSDQQEADVKKLREAHFAAMRPLFDSLRSAKSAFFALVKEPNVNDSTLSGYSKRISEIQSRIAKLTFAHLQRVRSLFNPDQQVKYDEFVQKMLQRTSRRRDSTDKK